MKSRFFAFLLFFVLASPLSIYAQKWVVTRGQAIFHAATQSTNAYSDLTTGTTFSYGSFFLNGTISLNNPFDYSFKLNFGNKDAEGADGMAFVIHNDPRGADAIGYVGMGLGFSDSPYSNDRLPESAPIMNSMAIEFDTYQNDGKSDPAEDHLAYVENGNNNHSDFPSTYTRKLPNIEDGQFHIFRIVWDPTTNNLRVYFDNTLKLNLYKHLQSIIGNNAYIGFTSTTGGCANQHTVEDINSPLPVKLLSFNGEYSREEGCVKLDWSTASELNNSHFVIERSHNGIDYEALGMIVGSGNSNSAKKYSFSDPVVKKASFYYRLVQFDFDGTSETFSPVFVKITDAEYEYKPEVSSINAGEMKISNATGGSVKIYSLDGRLLLDEKVLTAEYIIDFAYSGEIVIVDITNADYRWTKKILIKN